MPRFVAVYTMKPEDVAAFRARPKSEQYAIDKVGLQACKEWGKRNAAAIVATDVMVGKTRRVTKTSIADAQNQIAGFLIVEAADIAGECEIRIIGGRRVLDDRQAYLAEVSVDPASA